jgi:membrane-associated phospholipid phosphatase
MNAFDAAILHRFSAMGGRHPVFDHAVSFMSASYLVKGEAMMFAIWWFWFAPSKPPRRRREIIVSTIAAAAAAIVLGRFLAHFLPFRIRPVYNPEFAFGASGAKLRDWSAFPSDHAMLFAAVATGFLYISRRLGAAVWLYVIAFVLFPRAYLGLHHPTDLIAGAALGAAIAWIANRGRNPERLAAAPLAWLDAHPSSFYACLFLASFQIATMFDEPQMILRSLIKLFIRG